jgi:hypothetical protein
MPSGPGGVNANAAVAIGPEVTAPSPPPSPPLRGGEGDINNTRSPWA